MTKLQTVTHPLTGVTTYGCLLEPGDVVRAGDLYSDSDGLWHPVVGPGRYSVPPECVVAYVRSEG